ncbi:MAG: hypothetical protein AAFP84_21655, partial [Actinomycetota bacterium]
EREHSMSRYTVARDYRAVHKSSPIAFTKGADVDVDDDTATWVNRDSPGCLVPAKPAASPKSAKASTRKTTSSVED